MNTQRRNLYILTFVLFVVMLGYDIICPIFPFYIESMNASGMELGLLAASYEVPSFQSLVQRCVYISRRGTTTLLH